jgi:hypothetical protein
VDAIAAKFQGLGAPGIRAFMIQGERSNEPLAGNFMAIVDTIKWLSAHDHQSHRSGCFGCHLSELRARARRPQPAAEKPRIWAVVVLAARQMALQLENEIVCC